MAPVMPPRSLLAGCDVVVRQPGPYLLTPLAVGGLARTGSLSVGDSIAILTLPALLGLVVVIERNERLLPGRALAMADEANLHWPSALSQYSQTW